jgi:hypothetical protein
MDALLSGFRRVARYLTHPLVLIGFVLMLVFGFQWQLIESGIIPPMPTGEAAGVVHALLRYGFWIALALTAGDGGLLKPPLRIPAPVGT